MSSNYTVAAIDCGTNSIRLLIASAGPDGRLVEQARDLELVRLGQGVDATGSFHPDALERTFSACRTFAKTISDHHCDQVRFVPHRPPVTSPIAMTSSRESVMLSMWTRRSLTAQKRQVCLLPERCLGSR